MRLDVGAAARARNVVQVIDESGGLRSLALFHQEAGFAVTNNLFSCTAPVGDDGRAGSHRFNGGQPERFVPLDGEEQAKRLTHYLPQGQPFQLSQVSHAVARLHQPGLYALFKVWAVVDATGYQQAITRHRRDVYGCLDALLRGNAPGEKQRRFFRWRGRKGDGVQVQSVVYYVVDRGVGRVC